jgi:hypothetical protein
MPQVRRAVATLAGAALLAAIPASALASTGVMVVGPSSTLRGPTTLRTVTARRVTIGHRHCAVPARTALAALLATRVRVRVTDQAGCDPASMFVTRIGSVANRGVGGWEYKVGHRDPSLSAADPSGRLRGPVELLWYFCVRAGACQRTLSVSSSFIPSQQELSVTVVGYDSNGHSVPEAGATVHLGSATATSDANGHASFPLSTGTRTLYATKAGLVRSFPATVGVVA